MSRVLALLATLFSVASALRMTMMAEKSQAMPFLNRPRGLGAAGSMVGDVGFDPLARVFVAPPQRRILRLTALPLSLPLIRRASASNSTSTTPARRS